MTLALEDRHRIGGYREWAPKGALTRYCEAVWHYEAGLAAPPHRLLADNKPSLIFYYSSDGSGRAHDCRIVVSGNLSHSAWFRPRPGDWQIGIRLFPELSAECIGICPHEYLNKSGPPPKRILDYFLPLTDILSRLPPQAAGSVLADHFLRCVRETEVRNEHWAAALIRKADGRVPVSEIASKLDSSERQLRRRFESVMGLTPKAYSRIIRHLNVIRLSDRLTTPDWADIALRSGYCDQSHMIRDIGDLTGVSPARLHAERRSESEISNT